MRENAERRPRALTKNAFLPPGLRGGWFAAVLLCLTPTLASAVELASPSGEVSITFLASESGSLCYNVSYRGKPVLADSRLGLALDGAPDLRDGFRVVEVRRDSHDQTWQPVYGERGQIRDNYNQMIVQLLDTQDPPRRMQLVFRAYDEGAAFCYTIPAQGDWRRIRIKSEDSQFSFRDDHTAWPVYSAQGDQSKAVEQYKKVLEIADANTEEGRSAKRLMNMLTK